jgi:hypothetical protein
MLKNSKIARNNEQAVKRNNLYLSFLDIFFKKKK